MEILVNNYKDSEIQENKYPRNHVCSNCKSELLYNKEDLKIGEYGLMYFVCPLCGNEEYTFSEDEVFHLTKDNIEFPKHFTLFSTEENAVETCKNDYVVDGVKRAVNYFRENKDALSWTTATGNTQIHVYRYDGDEMYEVVVSRNYYKTEIPFESQDYL